MVSERIKKSKELGLIEKLILKNPELDKLVNMLSQFNIFETLDIVNAEIRHSNVLAWLFYPDANHGLGEYFLKQFLKNFISANKEYITSEINIFDFEIFGYRDVEIRREWNNIDILIIIKEKSKDIAITIENKLKTSEHGNQLQRYREIVEKNFKDFEKIFIYLSPYEDIPSDETWIAISYDTISDLIDDLLENRKDMLSENVLNFIEQYKIILRRYVVGNSEIEQICKDLYKKHQKALDLIFQFKPDINLEISEYLQKLLRRKDDIFIDSAGKTVIRFSTAAIDKKIKKIGEGWGREKRVLMYEFSNYEKRLALRLIIGPSEQEYRKKLFKFFKLNKKLFSYADRTFGVKWHTIYQKNFLLPKDFKNAAIDNLKDKIDHQWEEFIKNDLLKIDEYINNL